MMAADSQKLPRNSNWTAYINKLIAREISSLTRYYNCVIQWHPRLNDSGVLLERIESDEKKIILGDDALPDLSNESDKRTAVLLNGNFNHEYDIEKMLNGLKPLLSRTSRLVVVLYNPYLSWLYRLANLIGLRQGPIPTTFITKVDLANLAKICGFNIVRSRGVGFLPWRLFGIGTVINGFLKCVPLIRWLSFSYVVVLQPIIARSGERPSLSCVIPARNERGNIESAVARLIDFPYDLEIIFVEGNSTDKTWEEIIRVREAYQGRVSIQIYQQSGAGKSDAVRLGFSKSKGDLLTILDADLTMPPELLHRFYDAYLCGQADFVNGSRLVYPMEGEAMRFLNQLGNKFFARTLSWVLDTPLGDSLCGTKLMARHDYERMVEWRKDFGDFDPFGDFEMLFPAAVLGLGIIDVPIRYRSRTYGSTNISRFRHGLVLLKMTFIGFRKIKIL